MNTFVNFMYTKINNADYDVIINTQEDFNYVSTVIYVSLHAYPNSVRPSTSAYDFTTNGNMLRITSLPNNTTLYITIANPNINYTDVYTSALELPYGDAPIPISGLGQKIMGCATTINYSNYVYSYYSLLRSTIDANVPTSLRSSTVVRFELNSNKNEVSGTITNFGANNSTFALTAHGPLDISYYALFPSSSYNQVQLAIKTESCGAFALTINAIFPPCSSSNPTTISSSSPTTISSTFNGRGYYAPNTNCWWLLSPLDPTMQHMKLSFNSFSLARNSSLSIYTTSSNTPLVTYNGYSIPPPMIFPNTRSLLVAFVSDPVYTSTGFQLSYAPMTSLCPKACSNNGECTSNQCVCNDGYYGSDCSQIGCPTTTCSGHGICDSIMCHCSTGYYGYNCESTCPGGNLNPCYLRGTCDQKIGVCTCTTSQAFGYACQYINCTQQCHNGGMCNYADGQCICPTSYSGSQCQYYTYVPLSAQSFEHVDVVIII